MSQVNHKILIVDDDDFSRSILVNTFKMANFDVLEAKDGLEGLNTTVKEKPQIVITGISMPNMNGFELLKILKGNVETSSIPVFLFSHLGREEDRQKGEELGARAFLVKGIVSPKEMVDLIKGTLEGTSYQVEIEL